MQILKKELNYKSTLSVTQFLGNGFAERKLTFLQGEGGILCTLFASTDNYNIW
jgi:hypothetical protein